MPETQTVCGVLLAGGRSRRMGGGDKCLASVAGRTLLRRIADIAAPQVGPMLLNTNSDPALFADYGLPVAADVVEGFAGPLAGILTGLEWARQNAPGCAWVASFACDAPFLPEDLVDRMAAPRRGAGADMACAASGGRDHPVFGLWPVRLAGALRRALVEDGLRKVDAWTARYRLAKAMFAADPVDPFFSVNRPEDAALAEDMLAGS